MCVWPLIKVTAIAVITRYGDVVILMNSYLLLNR